MRRGKLFTIAWLWVLLSGVSYAQVPRPEALAVRSVNTVRVIVRTAGNPDIKILRSSVEVFDNATGRTRVVIPPVDRETHE